MTTAHEEDHELKPIWGWAILLLFCGMLLGWGLFLYFTVPDAPRHWDFGELPDTPSQSIYSMARAPAGPAERQLPLLPEAETNIDTAVGAGK